MTLFHFSSISRLAETLGDFLLQTKRKTLLPHDSQRVLSNKQSLHSIIGMVYLVLQSFKVKPSVCQKKETTAFQFPEFEHQNRKSAHRVTVE